MQTKTFWIGIVVAVVVSVLTTASICKQLYTGNRTDSLNGIKESTAAIEERAKSIEAYSHVIEDKLEAISSRNEELERYTAELELQVGKFRECNRDISSYIEAASRNLARSQQSTSDLQEYIEITIDGLTDQLQYVARRLEESNRVD